MSVADDGAAPGGAVNTGLLALLDRTVTCLLAFLVALAPMSAGVEHLAPETAFWQMVLFVTAGVWALRKLAARDATLNLPGGVIAAVAFLGAGFVALLAMQDGGDAFTSEILFGHWACELVFFLLLLDHLSTRERTGAVVAALLAVSAMVIVYGVYQRAYALEYFVAVVGDQAGLAERMVGSSTVLQEYFQDRLRNPRIYGPYGYPNALASLLVLILPVIWWLGLSAWGALRQRWRGGLFLALGMLGIAALCFSGSRGGMLAGKLTELIAFLGAGYAGTSRRKGLWREVGAAWLVLTIAGAALAGPVTFTSQGEHAGQLALAIVWCAEIFLIARFILPGHRPRLIKGTRVLGAVAFAGLLAAGVYLAAGAPAGPQRVREKIQRVQEGAASGRNTLGVRWHYWKAAARMWADHPVTGVGPDRFATWYSSYKEIGASEVKRVHNHYLQLAADGGLLLLAAFLTVAVAVVGRRDWPEPLPLEPKAADRRRPVGDRAGAALAALAALAITMSPLFDGFGIEFVYAALAREMPQWPADGLVNGGVNLLLLPVAGLLSAWLAWPLLVEDRSRPAIRRMLQAGLAGVLLHVFVDHTLSMRFLAISFWAVAAVLVVTGWPGPLAARRGWRLSERASSLGMGALVTGLFVLLAIAAIAGPPRLLWPMWLWERSMNLRAAEHIYRNASNPEEKQLAARLYQREAEAAPRHVEPHRYLSMLQKNSLQGRMPAIAAGGPLMPVEADLRRSATAHARRVAELHGGYAAAQAFLGRTLAHLYPRDRERLAEAREAFAAAHGLNPHRPAYLMWLGRIAERLGETGAAIGHYREALDLDSDPRLIDERPHLESAERAWTEARLDVLAGGESPGSTRTPPAPLQSPNRSGPPASPESPESPE
jgi:hypothetical protein